MSLSRHGNQNIPLAKAQNRESEIPKVCHVNIAVSILLAETYFHAIDPLDLV
jgi:hypothetical protein